MDDVLVNFDVTCAKAAVGLLRDFAEHGHQLLMFTCHEHVARMFRAAQVDVRTLPGNVLRADDTPLPEPEPEPAPIRQLMPEPVAVVAPVVVPPPVVPAPQIMQAQPLRVAEVIPLATPVAMAEPIRKVRPRRKLHVAPQPVIRRRLVRQERWVDSVPWSNEEFEGELADQVRRDSGPVEYIEEVLEPVHHQFHFAADEDLTNGSYNGEDHLPQRGSRYAR